MTVHDYQLLPETGPRFQLIQGELYPVSSPNTYHAIITRNLSYLLMRYLRNEAVGEIFHAPLSVSLSDIDVFQPDIFFFSKDQHNYLDESGATSAPWLVVEILSPSSRPLDLGPKREVYARCGSRELWLIDPDKRELAVYLLREDAERPVRLVTESESFTSALLPGLEISLGKILAR